LDYAVCEGGGGVSINVNNEQGEFFRTFKGLRKGDPMPPLMFNLVGDALAAMIESTKVKGRLGRLVPHLINGGITHLQYANDTILLIHDKEEYILNLKLIIYCFENMSDMKVNYHKIEMYVLGGDSERREEVTSMLNCKLGNLTMT
jgi:hypothetical protein